MIITSKQQAVELISLCLGHLKYMEDNLSGCDWCCGRGEEAYAQTYKKILIAKIWLAFNEKEIKLTLLPKKGS